MRDDSKRLLSRRAVLRAAGAAVLMVSVPVRLWSRVLEPAVAEAGG